MNVNKWQLLEMEEMKMDLKNLIFANIATSVAFLIDAKN